MSHLPFAMALACTAAPPAKPQALNVVLVTIDADVLGRRRTGDETYVENLLRVLPRLAGDEFCFAAVTRRPSRLKAI